jgi:hypothetical protein
MTTVISQPGVGCVRLGCSVLARVFDWSEERNIRNAKLLGAVESFVADYYLHGFAEDIIVDDLLERFTSFTDVNLDMETEGNLLVMLQGQDGA